MSLYPQINLPTLTAPRSKNKSLWNKTAPTFDFEVGEFLFDAAGRPIFADSEETFQEWCLKVCMTERNTRLAYSEKIGTEMRNIPQVSHEVAKSQIIRTITESIMVHPQAEYVKNFSFRNEAEHLWVSFDVKGKNFERRRLEVEL